MEVTEWTLLHFQACLRAGSNHFSPFLWEGVSGLRETRRRGVKLPPTAAFISGPFFYSLLILDLNAAATMAEKQYLGWVTMRKNEGKKPGRTAESRPAISRWTVIRGAHGI